MDKFQNKYRIPSARLQGWDYGQNGAYFVTICTQNRECYFGDILEGKMILSEMGMIARDNLFEIKNQFPFVELDAFVVMPDHIHCVIVINNTRKDAIYRVSSNNEIIPNNPMLSHNLSRIIRWYKGRTSFDIRNIHADFSWQSRFYDHIIKDDNMYRSIINYIENNPLNWKR
ncbi:MAG: Transposase like protein [Bacteroidetes bacterium]|nr:Transposase like protein [Bacteroidota bacterium]